MPAFSAVFGQLRVGFIGHLFEPGLWVCPGVYPKVGGHYADRSDYQLWEIYRSHRAGYLVGWAFFIWTLALGWWSNAILGAPVAESG